MRHILLLLLCCLSQHYLFSQAPSFLDSLERELKLHPQEDSIKLSILDNLGFAYHEENPKRGIQFSEEQLLLSKKQNNLSAQAAALSNIGINQWAQGLYTQALESYTQSKKIYENLGKMRQTANINSRIATVYFSTSDYSKALDIYFTNLAQFEKSKDSTLIAACYGNIALCFSHLSKFEKAINYYKKAIKVNSALNQLKGLADNYTNLGNMYDNSLKSDSAIIYYNIALQISRKNEYNRNVASNLANMGIAFTTLRQYSNGYHSLKKALPFYRQSNSLGNIAVIQLALADIFLQAPDSFFKNNSIKYSERTALTKGWLDSSLLFYRSGNNAAGQAEVMEKISLYYEQEHNYEKALAAYKIFKQLQDTVLNDEKNQQVESLEMKYNFSKREDSIRTENEQIALATSAEIRRQSTYNKTLFWSGFGTLAALLIIFLLYKRRRDAEERQQNAEFRTEVAETEMKALRTQINPHFIFNSLNSIGDFISKNNIDEADRYLTKFAKLMRLVLENSEKREVLLVDDLQALEWYIQLEMLRLKDKFDYRISIDEDIDAENTLVPPLIFQPIVENSIWHGIARKEGKGEIIIQIRKISEKIICCMIEDNGIGRSTIHSDKQGKSSLGMKITQARIDILKKTYKLEAKLTLEDLTPGVKVSIELPYLKST